MRAQPLVGQIETLSSPPEKASAEERTPDYSWYQQTEYVPFLPFGIGKKKIVFQNWFRDLEDTIVPPPSDIGNDNGAAREGGVKSKVYAPAGLTIEAVFRVEKRKVDYRKETISSRNQYEKDEADLGPEGGWRLVEETEMTCSNALVKWLSVGQHRKAQKQMLDSILHEAQKRASVPGNCV